MVEYFLCAYTEIECVCFGGDKERRGDRDIDGGGGRGKKRGEKTGREEEI